MRKQIVLLSAVIIVGGMLAALHLFVGEEDYDRGKSVGEKLMEMEHETTERVENLRQEMQTGRLSEADLRLEIEDNVRGILYNLRHMHDGTGSYLNAAYHCNVIRQLGLRLEDRPDMTEAERTLQNDRLSRFADRVFGYCLDVSANQEEEATYIALGDQADEIEADLDRALTRYTGRVYAWYTDR